MLREGIAHARAESQAQIEELKDIRAKLIDEMHDLCDDLLSEISRVMATPEEGYFEKKHLLLSDIRRLADAFEKRWQLTQERDEYRDLLERIGNGNFCRETGRYEDFARAILAKWRGKE